MVLPWRSASGSRTTHSAGRDTAGHDAADWDRTGSGGQERASSFIRMAHLAWGAPRVGPHSPARDGRESNGRELPPGSNHARGHARTFRAGWLMMAVPHQIAFSC